MTSRISLILTLKLLGQSNGVIAHDCEVLPFRCTVFEGALPSLDVTIVEPKAH